MADPPIYELQDSSGNVVGYLRQDISNSETTLENDQTNTTFTVENGRVLVDGSEIQGTDTRTDVSEDGTTIVADTEDINFTESGDATVSVSDDGDGTVTVDVSATGTDTRTNVSDSGTEVVVDTTDINFDTDLEVVDDGDGSVTVNSTASGGSGDVSTVQAYAHEWGRF
jgi:hypothetical protein